MFDRRLFRQFFIHILKWHVAVDPPAEVALHETAFVCIDKYKHQKSNLTKGRYLELFHDGSEIIRLFSGPLY